MTPGLHNLLGRLADVAVTLQAQQHPGAADVRAAREALELLSGVVHPPARGGMGTARGMVDWLCARLDLDPYPAEASEEECVAWLGHAFVLEYCETSARDCAYEAANILQVHLDTLSARREAAR